MTKLNASVIMGGVMAMMSLLPGDLVAVETTVAFTRPQAENPEGEHGFATNGDEIELSLIGGTDKNSSWVMVHGQPLQSVADLSKGESLVLTLENVRFEGHNVAPILQSLHVTLSPKPAVLPYQMDKALSFEVWGSGEWTLGVRKDKGGWPARLNSRVLGSGKMPLQRVFPKMELTVSVSKVRVAAFDLNGQLAFEMESEELPELASWTQYGVNLLLQKRREGGQTQLIATVERVTAARKEEQ